MIKKKLQNLCHAAEIIHAEVYTQNYVRKEDLKINKLHIRYTLGD